VATILIPVLVPDTGNTPGDTPIETPVDADTDGYATLWQVVRALRAHDESLAATLDLRRTILATTP
jgi:predicted helicase